MNVKIPISFFLILSTSPLVAAPAREGLAVQEMRLQCEEFGQKLHHQKVEIEILNEKILSLENTISSLRQELCQSGKTEISKDKMSSLEKRVFAMEKTQETLIGDLKVLKNHLNESSQSITTCQTQLSQIEKQLSQDIKSLKGSLQSMISLLQKGEAIGDKIYVVKPGDSLGKIALEQHVETKRLKELNHLTNDRIYVGQKLQLP